MADAVAATDADVICAFMVPKPQFHPNDMPEGFDPKWWLVHLDRELRATWHPRDLDLVALHQVEARLTDEQWGIYGASIFELHVSQECLNPWRLICHLSAAQKIAALAEVIRQTGGGR